MLKSICIIAALSATPFAAQAQFSTAAQCTSLGGIAETIMLLRQNGVPMSSVISKLDPEMYGALILFAYQQPRYSSPSFQSRAIEEFRNGMETACFKGLL